MTDRHNPPGIPFQDQQRIDEICELYEQALQSGARPKLESFLVDLPANARGHLVEELLLLEVDYRQRQGESITLEACRNEYNRRSTEASNPAEQVGQPTGNAGMAAESQRDDYADIETASGEAPWVGSEYEDLQRIGEGGMGVVYRARHAMMDRIVALKMISPKVMSTPNAAGRFLQEVKALSKLTHPNIVTAFHAGRHGDSLFLAMEWVDGRSLRRLVQEEGPQPIPRAVDWMIQAATALSYAHRNGVVHRDIKPSNIMVDSEGSIKILDLGLAQLSQPSYCDRTSDDMTGDLTDTGDVLGTRRYMAPEQLLDAKHVDHRADVFGLGCTLHFLITGKPPAAMSGLRSVVEPRSAHSDSDRCLDSLLSRMIAISPDDRFSSMDEVFDALRSLQTAHGEHDATGESSLASSVSRWPLALAGLLVAVVIGTLVIQGMQGKDPVEYQRVNSRLASAPQLAATQDAAKWVLSHGGQMRVLHEHQDVLVVSTDQLPDGAYDIEMLMIEQAKPGVRDGLARLLELPQLEELTLDACYLTDADLKVIGELTQLKYLSILDNQLTSAGIKQFSRLRHLEDLFVSDTGVDDQALPVIGQLDRLQQLDLSGTSVSDAGMHHLRDLKNLTRLGLAETNVTGRGFVHFADMVHMKYLYFGGLAIDDDDLVHLSSMKQLARLNIANADVSNKGMATVADFTFLKELNVDASHVGDDGVACCESLENLEVFHLSNTFVTDKCLSVLKDLPKLRTVSLQGTAVTPAGIQSLQAAKPSCVIISGPGSD